MREFKSAFSRLAGNIAALSVYVIDRISVSGRHSLYGHRG